MPINVDLEGNISIEGLLFIPNPRIKPAIMMLLTQYEQFIHFVLIWQDRTKALSINTSIQGIENCDNICIERGFWSWNSLTASSIKCSSAQMTKLVWTIITLRHWGFNQDCRGLIDWNPLSITLLPPIDCLIHPVQAVYPASDKKVLMSRRPEALALCAYTWVISLIMELDLRCMILHI